MRFGVWEAQQPIGNTKNYFFDADFGHAASCARSSAT